MIASENFSFSIVVYKRNTIKIFPFDLIITAIYFISVLDHFTVTATTAESMKLKIRIRFPTEQIGGSDP